MDDVVGADVQANVEANVEPSPELLNGWCGTAPSRAAVYRPTVAGEVKGVLDAAPDRGVIARGLGRSYGDPAQNAGGAVVELTRMSGLRALDLERGIVTAWAGTSIDELLRWLVPLGWFVPVTPGTRFVTVGGAIGSDIHGKGHHIDGTWGAHVHALTIQMATGEVRTLTPTDTPEEFWATVGGLGLTGIVLDATFDLVPIETSLMSVHTERARDLDDLMAKMIEGDDAHHYSVAWLDVLARGAKLGRGVLGRGDHARLDELPERKRARPLDYRAEMRLTAPPWMPNGLINPLTTSAFNEVWFRKAPAVAPRPRVDPDVLASARRRRALEPGLRIARVPAVPVRRPVRRERGRAGGGRAAERSAYRIVPHRPQDLRTVEPGSAVVPERGLDARDRRPGGRPDARSAARRPRRARDRSGRLGLPREGLPSAS